MAIIPDKTQSNNLGICTHLRTKLSSCDEQASNYKIKKLPQSNHTHHLYSWSNLISWMVTICCVIFAIVMYVPMASYRGAMIIVCY